MLFLTYLNGSSCQKISPRSIGVINCPLVHSVVLFNLGVYPLLVPPNGMPTMFQVTDFQGTAQVFSRANWSRAQLLVLNRGEMYVFACCMPLILPHFSAQRYLKRVQQ